MTCFYDELKMYAIKWVEQVPSLLWSLRMSMNRLTGFTPFFLVHGAEAIILFDLEFSSRGSSPATRTKLRNNTKRTLTCSRKSGMLLSYDQQGTKRAFIATMHNMFKGAPSL